MKKFLNGIVMSLLLLATLPAFSQKPQRKFGDLQPQDFSASAYPVDSSASGVVLFDIASSKYAGDTHGGLTIAFKRHTRIRLLNRNAFDMATVTIPLYASGT